VPREEGGWVMRRGAVSTIWFGGGDERTLASAALACWMMARHRERLWVMEEVEHSCPMAIYFSD
jgi:hypothetical protein